ncbi:hypothetical protein L901_20125 [Agrobacterium sp. D14]|nr:hypothetical protein L901_20125 [Agrobacterium sp. D14]
MGSAIRMDDWPFLVVGDGSDGCILSIGMECWL